MTTDDHIATTAATTSTVGWIVSSVKVIMYRGGQLAVGLGAVLLTLLYFKQESMLYFPEIGGIPRRPNGNPRRYRSPAEHQIHFEDVFIPCSDGVQIHAWLMMRTPEQNPLPTLLFFHGNAGNIGLRLPNAMQMMQYLNVNILMVEYRGFGNSDNVSPTEAGLKLDGQAALQWAQKHPKLDPAKLFLFGRSLGGAVAFATAAHAQQSDAHQSNSPPPSPPPPPVAGLIVENTFTSIPAMVDQILPWVAPFKGLILRMKWDSLEIAPTLTTTPVLYLAGANDQLVPHQQMLQLFQASQRSRTSLTRIHVVPDGTHNETWMQGGQPYWDACKAFLTAAVQQATASRGPTAAAAAAAAAAEPSPPPTESTHHQQSKSQQDDKSAIPIMSNRLFGMVKDAVSSGKNKSGGSGVKKEL